MKINNFRGELTDISAKKEPLAVNYPILLLFDHQGLSFLLRSVQMKRTRNGMSCCMLMS